MLHRTVASLWRSAGGPRRPPTCHVHHCVAASAAPPPPPPPPPAQPAAAFSPTPHATVAGTRTDLGVVFVSPQIPQNTGTTARTCAATQLSLTLVGPNLGFTIDDSRLKRSGLDYWGSVAGAQNSEWAAFEAAAGPHARFIAFSTKGTVHYATPGLYKPPPGGTTYLVFGSETAGLPPEAHAAAAARGAIVTLPIDKTHVRSLNLAVSAGVGIYEALRQLDGVGE